eukprot:s5200_g1.t1
MSEPCPTALHSRGSVLYRCPCGRRRHGTCAASLPRKGPRGVEVESGLWPHKARHIHLRELQLLMAFPPFEAILPDCRAQLALFANAVSPVHGIWIFGHLLDFLGMAPFGNSPGELLAGYLTMKQRDLSWPNFEVGVLNMTVHFQGVSTEVACNTAQTVSDLLKAEALIQGTTRMQVFCEGLVDSGGFGIPGIRSVHFAPEGMSNAAFLRWAGIQDNLRLVDEQGQLISPFRSVSAWRAIIVQLSPEGLDCELSVRMSGFGIDMSAVSASSLQVSHSVIGTGLWHLDQSVKSDLLLPWAGTSFAPLVCWLPSFSAAVVELWPSTMDEHGLSQRLLKFMPLFQNLGDGIWLRASPHLPASCAVNCLEPGLAPLWIFVLVDRHWTLASFTVEDNILKVVQYYCLGCTPLLALAPLIRTVKDAWQLQSVHASTTWDFPQQRSDSCGTLALAHFAVKVGAISYEQAVHFQDLHDSLAISSSMMWFRGPFGYWKSFEQILPAKGVPPAEAESRAAAAIKTFGAKAVHQALQAKNAWIALKSLRFRRLHDASIDLERAHGLRPTSEAFDATTRLAGEDLRLAFNSFGMPVMIRALQHPDGCHVGIVVLPEKPVTWMALAEGTATWLQWQHWQREQGTTGVGASVELEEMLSRTRMKTRRLAVLDGSDENPPGEEGQVGAGPYGGGALASGGSGGSDFQEGGSWCWGSWSNQWKVHVTVDDNWSDSNEGPIDPEDESFEVELEGEEVRMRKSSPEQVKEMEGTLFGSNWAASNGS